LAGDEIESKEDFEAERKRVNYLMERIANFIEHQSPIVPHVILPEDSVSNIGKGKTIAPNHSKIGHKSGSRTSSSVGSTTSSAKAKAIAKKAALEVEAANFKKKNGVAARRIATTTKTRNAQTRNRIRKGKGRRASVCEN